MHGAVDACDESVLLLRARSYTGVYAERFRSGDGRINGEADNRRGQRFVGNTNTGTDEVIHDIKVLMRSDMKGGSMLQYVAVVTGSSSPSMA